MSKKSAYICGSVFAFLSVVFTVLVKTVDVGVWEKTGEKMGLLSLNSAFHKLTGTSDFWYELTNKMGIASIALGLLILCYGGIILLKRKSFFKVDRFIYALGFLYVVLGGIYVIFEKVIINYRPIILKGDTQAEASFPSSHTLLITTIIITAAITFARLLKGKKAFVITVWVVALSFTALGVTGRLLSGYHWLTDIIASLLISAALIFFYAAVSKEKDGKVTEKP